MCDPLRLFNPTSLGCAGVPPEDVDHLMWGSDYPHFDSTFPKSREAIEHNVAGVAEDERELILGQTMLRVYNLQDVLAPAPQPVAV